MRPDKVKEILSNIISTLSDNPSDFLQNPSKDFSSNRKLPFESDEQILIKGYNLIHLDAMYDLMQHT